MDRCCRSAGVIEQGPLLLIGYGNELRGDDGVGPRLARKATNWGLAGLVCRDVHQLVPELAPEIALARAVIFLDASLSSKTTGQLLPIEPREGTPLGHFSDPQTLLALAQSLYGRTPPAWLLPLPAVDFKFGEQLSPTAASGLENAERHLKDWLYQYDNVASVRLASHVALS